MNLIKKWINEKREYKQQMERVKELPEDYRFVYEKIHGYIWRESSMDGSDMLRIQQEIITLFEDAASQGMQVLEVTGKDVADFCNEFLNDSKKWTDKYRKNLNREVLQINNTKK